MIGKDPKDAQRDALVRMVILDEVPLSLVESRYFRQFMKTVSKGYQSKEKSCELFKCCNIWFEQLTKFI
jgi:hypothetical protein